MASNPRFVAIKSNGHATAAANSGTAVQSSAAPGSISVQLTGSGAGGPDPFDNEDLERHM